MAENITRNSGRPGQYKFDRGGAPTEMGPFIGIVTNNVDPTRSGRLQVYIEEFGKSTPSGAPNLSDKSLWRTVSYCPPFFGSTPRDTSKQSSSSVGEYAVNTNSYGMWFVPPDLGVKVLCFFVAGDPNQGYYVGCIPQPQCNQMVPAIGGVPKNERQLTNSSQLSYCNSAELIPVTEINITDEGTTKDPKFFDKKKPCHSYVAQSLFQQGIINDTVRGPINSSSQRESPSQCFGIITPGRFIHQGNLSDDKTFLQDVQNETPEGAAIIGRRGGHSLVLDDGDTAGKSNMVRIRSSKGHQITMSDDNNCFYIIHANGQTWIEFGQEGTVDVFSTNSVNIRTQGTINLHADEDINIHAGKKLNIKSMDKATLQSDVGIDLATKGPLNLYSGKALGIKADGTIGIQCKTLSSSTTTTNLNGRRINLNGGGAAKVATPTPLVENKMPETKFDTSTGWQVEPNKLKSITTRAPTHEPYPYHNQGVKLKSSAEPGQPSKTPGGPSMPSGWGITKR